MRTPFYIPASVIIALVWTGLAVLFGIVGWRIVMIWRTRNRDSASTYKEVVENLKNLRSRGLLDDDEFRAVKSNLGERLKSREDL